MARVPKSAATRIGAGLRKYQRIFTAAKDRDANESDTVVILADFLAEVLGYDKYAEITTEFSIRGTFCDLAVKVGGKVAFLLEAKAVGVALKEGHIRQAVGYAASNGVEWVVLTNGARWIAYRMIFEKPVEQEVVFDLDFLAANPTSAETVERFYLLSKEGSARSAIEEFHQEREARNPFIVGAVLLSEPVLSVVRRELRRASPGARIEIDDLRQVLREDVIKRDVVEGEAARLAGGRAKRAQGRALRQTQKVDDL